MEALVVSEIIIFKYILQNKAKLQHFLDDFSPNQQFSVEELNKLNAMLFTMFPRFGARNGKYLF